jgi:hypothetical protein
MTDSRIDKTVYAVNNPSKQFRSFGPVKSWQELQEKQNRKNKGHIEGYTHLLRNGQRRVFHNRIKH